MCFQRGISYGYTKIRFLILVVFLSHMLWNILILQNRFFNLFNFPRLSRLFFIPFLSRLELLLSSLLLNIIWVVVTILFIFYFRLHFRNAWSLLLFALLFYRFLLFSLWAESCLSSLTYRSLLKYRAAVSRSNLGSGLVSINITLLIFITQRSGALICTNSRFCGLGVHLGWLLRVWVGSRFCLYFWGCLKRVMLRKCLLRE